MITTVVRFPLPQATTRDEAEEMFKASVPSFQGMAGLVRKYYILGEDGTGGAVYLWQSREVADRFHSQAWKKQLEQSFGAVPEVTFYETPVIVENSAAGE